MNILFVCSANKQRSKTAEDVFSEKYPEHSFLSAGTNKKICMQEGTTALDDDLLEWADQVLVMEEKHRKIIREQSKQKSNRKIIVLNIPDVYKYGQKELLNILHERTAGFFQELSGG